jgi:hypothetical protein
VRPYLEKTDYKKMSDEVAQGVGPKFKTQHCKRNKEKRTCLVLGGGEVEGGGRHDKCRMVGTTQRLWWRLL